MSLIFDRFYRAPIRFTKKLIIVKPKATPQAVPAHVTLDQLLECMPRLKKDLAYAQKVLPHINIALDEFGIVSAACKAAFMAQVGHESLDLLYREEIASGAAYDVGKLAIRLGNTPEDDGDGERLKGRGFIQTTGTFNYVALTEHYRGLGYDVDFFKTPELVATLDWAARSAAFYWDSKKLNAYAERNTQEAFDVITKRINGGTNGKPDRDKRWIRCKRVFGVA